MIDFSNPLNGRKWLNLLEAHSKYGMLFKKNIDHKKDYMGFSFRSNKLGLRGPENINADKVICGTSFAMGLSVNNTKNWYELDVKYENCFNIGMPIGFKNHLNLLKDYYKGSYDTLIFLYHPNIWVINKNFYKANKSHTDIFTSMKWTTNKVKIYYLYLRWLVKEKIKIVLNKKEKIIFENKEYYLNLNYSYFSDKNISDIEHISRDFLELSKKFKNVIVLKVPIKEEISLKHSNNKNLKLLNENYTKMWNIFICNLEKNVRVFDLENEFVLSDYLQRDTHWNEKGNLRFHQFIKKTTNILAC